MIPFPSPPACGHTKQHELTAVSEQRRIISGRKCLKRALFLTAIQKDVQLYVSLQENRLEENR